MKALALKQYDLYKKSVSGVSDFTPTKYESAKINMFILIDIALYYKIRGLKKPLFFSFLLYLIAAIASATFSLKHSHIPFSAPIFDYIFFGVNFILSNGLCILVKGRKLRKKAKKQEAKQNKKRKKKRTKKKK